MKPLDPDKKMLWTTRVHYRFYHGETPSPWGDVVLCDRAMRREKYLSARQIICALGDGWTPVIQGRTLFFVYEMRIRGLMKEVRPKLDVLPTYNQTSHLLDFVL